MKRNSSKIIQFFRFLRNMMVVPGFFFMGCLILSFTTLPFWGVHWLGTSLSKLEGIPGEIILLGGSGMPSESNLMRSWFAASAAAALPASRIWIVMPGDTADCRSTPAVIRKELTYRGVDPTRTRYVTEGANTRQQALCCALAMETSRPVLLVTSPENMRRTILCFRKAGFSAVNALPAFENAAEADFRFNDDDLEGKPSLLPDVGKNLQVRYQFWNHLKYEILIARELAALGYYKLRGWI